MSLASKLQLLGALRTAREALQGTEDPLAKLGHIKEIRALRVQLGAADTPPAPPADGPAATGDTEGGEESSAYPAIVPDEKAALNEHYQALAAIAAGTHDSEGLTELFARMQSAILSLNEDLQLDGPMLDAANAAITHWGELDQQLNG